MRNDNYIELKREVALKQLDKFIDRWEYGGKERSKVALDTYFRSKLLEAAPKERGWLWWKRETTPAERQLWLAAAWNDDDWLGEGLLYRYRAESYQTKRIDWVANLKVLRDAIQKSPEGSSVLVSARDWEFANRSF